MNAGEPIRFSCIQCGKPLRAAFALIGSKINCPVCNARVDVPIPDVETDHDAPTELLVARRWYPPPWWKRPRVWLWIIFASFAAIIALTLATTILRGMWLDAEAERIRHGAYR